MHFLLHLPDEAPVAATLHLPGKHNVQNALRRGSDRAGRLGVDPDQPS
jgi:UDP-N-acetylmuramate-alanine ligase